jgi:hypothetical protein
MDLKMGNTRKSPRDNSYKILQKTPTKETE